jgi:hypothetical protein
LQFSLSLLFSAAGYRQRRYTNLSASFAKGFFVVSVFRFGFKISFVVLWRFGFYRFVFVLRFCVLHFFSFI